MIWLISTGWKLSFLVTLQYSPCQSQHLGTCMGLFVINLTGIWKTFSKFDLYFVLQISQCQAASRISYLSKTGRRRWNYYVVNSDFPKQCLLSQRKKAFCFLAKEKRRSSFCLGEGGLSQTYSDPSQACTRHPK